METAQQRGGESQAIDKLEEAIIRACHTATKAGYDLDLYLRLLHPEAAEEPGAAAATPRAPPSPSKGWDAVWCPTSGFSDVGLPSRLCPPGEFPFARFASLR